MAGAVTFFVYRRLQANAIRPEMIKIVAAANEVPAGVALTQQDVILIDWPSNAPHAGSFAKLEDVVGRPLINSLAKGDIVVDRDLAASGSGIGLSVKIPSGMRATSVRSNEVVGVAGFLFPGSHVDVLGTFTVPGNPDPVTETLLQNVEVLTAGPRIEPDPTGKPQTVNVVTLLLSPEDSQKLLMASTHSTIQFDLRNGADQGKESVKPTRLNELVGAAPPTPPQHRVASRKAAPVTEPHVQTLPVVMVEVIQGQARKIEKFTSGNSEGESEKNR